MKRSTVGNSIKFLLKCFMVSLSFASISYAKPVSYEIPNNIDPSAKYFFFLHNYYVEQHGPNGDCKYYDILKTFTDKGFTVISEVRSNEIVPSQYAQKIVRQIKRLLDTGVPPEHITIAGHSKGGVISLCAASQLGNPKIGFIIMAGCEIKPLEHTYPDFTRVKGNFLSIYASSDSVANSCQNGFSKVIIGICYKEITVKSDKGHRLFFKPEDIWIEPVMTWINQRTNNEH
ncbi:MAG: hypothetical protein JRE65_01230 [Deltaproteobacteria bacterium]|nr:hypothetical protein [Deltaproteobacteria bacterium]